MEEYLEKEGCLFKLDIKQGYHHININENYQEFLGFAWVFPLVYVRLYLYSPKLCDIEWNSRDRKV